MASTRKTPTATGMNPTKEPLTTVASNKRILFPEINERRPLNYTEHGATFAYEFLTFIFPYFPQWRSFFEDALKAVKADLPKQLWSDEADPDEFSATLLAGFTGTVYRGVILMIRYLEKHKEAIKKEGEELDWEQFAASLKVLEVWAHCMFVREMWHLGHRVGHAEKRICSCCEERIEKERNEKDNWPNRVGLLFEKLNTEAGVSYTDGELSVEDYANLA